MELGYAWLKEALNLPDLPLPHASRTGTARRTLQSPTGTVEDYPPQHYVVEESVFGQLEFALKYDGINLAVLWHTMRAIKAEDLLGYIRQSPGSKYARTMGYFYEMLTGATLEIDFALSGAYPLLLDEARYITAEPVSVARWRVKDNLLGNAQFCPVIERSAAIEAHLGWSPKDLLDRLRQEYSPELFMRAASWLYLSETKSSNEIEQEHPSPQRAQRFVQLLKDAGQGSLEGVLSEDGLSKIQEAVVDKRTYVGLRGIQNFIGQPHTYGSVPPVDYPCPPADWVPSLMAGLAAAAAKAGVHPVVRAAVASFGFVFIHPFEDGNGRVSRYLIHDMYTRDGFTPQDFIFPVSAVMVQHQAEYKASLERYSKPVRRLAELEFDEQMTLSILNPGVLEPLYRFPDLTPQVEYLFDTTRVCAEEVVVHELDVLNRFERTLLILRETLDLVDVRMNQLVGLMHQNGGRLSNSKRKSMFQDLTDAEVEAAHAAYAEAFAPPEGAKQPQPESEP